jgi:hypothetical protein
MPLTGTCAWKEEGIGPEERIDRFFNLIDHAVEGGVSLSALYRRQHLKELLLYALNHCNDFCRTPPSHSKKDYPMPKLVLTSTFASSITVGDPGILAFNLAPKETKTVEATEVQIRQLTPGLEKLKAVGWLNYTVTDAAPAPEEVKPAVAAPPMEPTPTPAPEPVPAPVENSPEAPAEATAPAEETAPTPNEPAAFKAPSFDRKTRNR